MGKRDPRIDAIIERSAPFAKPILKHVRACVHQACPDVEETLKWGMPHFMYKGILCGVGSFKAHCVFGFWKGPRFERIETVKDLPPKRVLLKHVKDAMKMNDEGRPAPWRAERARKPKPAVRPPADLVRALKANKKALATFEGFSPSHKREYVEWITGAKTEETRERRLETAVEWMAQGKPRNWKYMKR